VRAVHLLRRSAAHGTVCNQRLAEPLTTERAANVTCKTCLRVMAASEAGLRRLVTGR